MARAVCSSCGAYLWWTASRGSRLRDLRSPCCDAEMRGPGRGTAELIRRCLVCRHQRLRIAFPSSYEGFLELVPSTGLCRRHRHAHAAHVEQAIRGAWWLAPELREAARAAYGRYLALEEGVLA